MRKILKFRKKFGMGIENPMARKNTKWHFFFLKERNYRFAMFVSRWLSNRLLFLILGFYPYEM
jgi:hypothetical protein